MIHWNVRVPDKVIGDIRVWLPQMLARYPGIKYELDGEQREQARAMGGREADQRQPQGGVEIACGLGEEGDHPEPVGEEDE